MLLVMSLFAPPPVTDDGSIAAQRTLSRQQMQRDRGHPEWVAFSLGQCDKKNHGWREGLPLTAPCQVSTVTGLHPPGKSMSNEKRILPSAFRRQLPCSVHWPVFTD
jgi:hypothetical protein